MSIEIVRVSGAPLEPGSSLPNFFVTASAPFEGTYVMYTPSSLASIPLIAPLLFNAPKLLLSWLSNFSSSSSFR
nr:MAG TPA: hypothetical protein [Caudoviricetes sp.]